MELARDLYIEAQEQFAVKNIGTTQSIQSVVRVAEGSGSSPRTRHNVFTKGLRMRPSPSDHGNYSRIEDVR